MLTHTQTDNTYTHTHTVITASMGALGTWVEWTPMGRIAGSNVLDACAFFLSTPDFQLQGLDVMKQVRLRVASQRSLTCALVC